MGALNINGRIDDWLCISSIVMGPAQLIVICFLIYLLRGLLDGLINCSQGDCLI